MQFPNEGKRGIEFDGRRTIGALSLFFLSRVLPADEI